MTKIDVEDVKPGIIVMNGLIGSCMEMFEIRVSGSTYHYWVRDLEVSLEVFRDSFELASRDRYDPFKKEAPEKDDVSVQEPD